MATTTTTTNNNNAATTAGNDVAEGPVLSVLNKRLRALKKKLNRIIHTEESVAQGKPINKEQEEVLRSKTSVLALIDELEKLRNPISSALTEELNLALKNQHQQPQPQQNTEAEPQPEPQAEPSSEPKNDAVVEDLINLIYFGSLFDVKSQNDYTSTMLTRTHERGCCLTYDYVTDDATDLLSERDLDLIAAMRGLLISRPAHSSLTHRDALQHCVEHARLWLSRAQQPIEPNADVTYAGLREKLNKIMSSEYFVTSPEIDVPVNFGAAGGDYGSLQVPVHGSISVEVEGSDSQSQEKDEGTINYEGQGSGGDQPEPEGELQEDEVEADNEVSVQHEQSNQQADGEYNNQRDVDAKEQQYYPRRGYQNQRGGRGGGGGRRGYSNGRGGRGGGRGGYQNGRNQYYDQPGNYYPRNNYYNNNRGRGGRGGGYYNNHGAGGQFNHVAGDVGVQS